ncbi:MAG: MbnP family protein [Bacteroidota bacterium]|nr:hypothetical protein [Ferruginibacter sp.]
MQTRFYLLVFAIVLLSGCQKTLETDSGNVAVKLTNMLGDGPITLESKTYINAVAEPYTVSKLRYYITNVRLIGTSSAAEAESYHLIDAEKPESLQFSFTAPSATFNSIEFLLGVDSTRNVSGAQTGALDPLNDMFWTWNSGYVMLKIEGNSPVSPVAGKKFEYHLGGFSGPNNVLKKIQLPFPAGKLASIQKGKTCEISIMANLDKLWAGPNALSIAATPVCTTPGAQALKIADNYQHMFTLSDVVNNK